MRFEKPRCPECNKLADGTLERVPGLAIILWPSDCVEDEVPGNCSYEGYTEMFWNGQETAMGPNGGTLLFCRDCSVEWESEADFLVGCINPTGRGSART